MKTNYEKPVILFESFELNQSIASSCGVTGGGNTLGKPTHWDKSTCGWGIGGTIVIWTATPTCNDIAGKDEEVEGMCYNAPSPDQSIFSS